MLGARPLRPRFLIIMGVSGCGKTSVGEVLASMLGWDFYDADDFHPPENITKMTSGIPSVTTTELRGWPPSTI